MDLTFVGRDDFLRELVEQLDHSSVLLEGARGIGKTRLLERLESHPPKGTPVLRFDLQGVSSAQQLVERMEQHVQLRRNRIEDWVSSLLSDWRRQDPWESLQRLLSQRAPSGCVLLFDEVQTYIDHLARTDENKARTELSQLDGLHKLGSHVRFLLTGSITLRSVSRALGLELSADWVSLRMPPLDAASSAALFVESCSSVCSDEVVAEGCRWTGGSPRWIKRLAQSTVGSAERPLQLEHLQAALERLFDARPFEVDLGHLRRHPEREHLRAALSLASMVGASQNSVLLGLQARGLNRRGAEEVLGILRDEFYLDEACALTLPLLAEWFRRQA